MKRLTALIRREFWENKGALRTTPLIIGGIYIVFLLMSIFTTAHFDNELYTFREAVRLRPTHARAHLTLGTLERRSGNLDAADGRGGDGRVRHLHAPGRPARSCSGRCR